MTRNVKNGIIWGFIAIVAVGVVIGVVKVNSGPREQAQIPDTMTVSDKDWSKGNKEAKVIITEYSDFQCPACRSYESLVKQVITDLGDKTLFVYRHFPLSSIHKNAQMAAQAAEAAGRQGKFWEMHDMLFDRQKDWAEQTNAKDLFVEYAGFIGINKDQFKTDMTSSEVKDRIKIDVDSGTKASVQGTPTFFVNGQRLEGPNSIEDFKKAVEDAEKKLQSQTPANTGEEQVK